MEGKAEEKKGGESTEFAAAASSKKRRGKVFRVPKGGHLKEKRARLYIIRRCILMLICWKERADQEDCELATSSVLSFLSEAQIARKKSKVRFAHLGLSIKL